MLYSRLFAIRSCAVRLLVVLAVAILTVSAVRATTFARPQDLARLVEESRRAVLVEVVDVRYDYDENRVPSTFVTLRVDDAIYGEELPDPGQTFQVKLFGAPVQMPDGLRVHLDGTPRYATGERYLLLLKQDSKLGFTNTAGLMFGAFRVEQNDRGRLLATSLGGNRHAFGEQGLAAWLDESVAGAEHRAVADPAAAVPYRLLRLALSNLWTAGGGTPRPAPAKEVER
jgi:hypothetical protein